MDLARRFIQAETEFPAAFTHCEQTLYGPLYHNAAIADSHDSNHAVLVTPGDDPAGAIAHLTARFVEIGVDPRLRYYGGRPCPKGLRSAMVDAGYSLIHSDQPPCYCLHRDRDKLIANDVNVRQVTECTPEHYADLVAVHGERFASVTRCRANNSGARLYAAFVDGHVVATAISETVAGLRRVDEVHTTEEYRRRGIGRAVMTALILDHYATFDLPLYLWADNPHAIKMYESLGFENTSVQICTLSACINDNTHQQQGHAADG